MLSLIISYQPKQTVDTFKANILRVCEFDKLSLVNKRTKNDMSECKYYETATSFQFDNSLITIIYKDSINETPTTETYLINKSSIAAGLNTYYCSIENTNVVMYFYKPMDLVKIYYYSTKEKKTFVYFYLKQ